MSLHVIDIIPTADENGYQCAEVFFDLEESEREELKGKLQEFWKSAEHIKEKGQTAVDIAKAGKDMVSGNSSQPGKIRDGGVTHGLYNVAKAVDRIPGLSKVPPVKAAVKAAKLVLRTVSKHQEKEQANKEERAR